MHLYRKRDHWNLWKTTFCLLYPNRRQLKNITMQQLSQDANWVQHAFPDLEMNIAHIEVSTNDSASSSFFWSDPLSYTAARSVSNCGLTVVDSGLALKDDSHKRDILRAKCKIISGLPKFSWLHQRCEGDELLFFEVLSCFCEQGHAHLLEVRLALKDMETRKLSFHATFLSDSASNIGAWAFQRRCLELCHVSDSFVWLGTDGQDKLRQLVEQVEEAFGYCLGAIIARTSRVPVLDEEDNLGKWQHDELFENPFNDDSPHRSALSGAVRSPREFESPHVGTSFFYYTTSDTKEASMPDFFRRLRQQLDKLRRYNRTTCYREAREQAAAILGAAAIAGSQLIAGRAARVLARTGYVAAGTLDDLELHIDTAEAAWWLCRSMV